MTAAIQVFMLPDLGEGLTEAEIVEWRVAVGDIVQVDQSVVEVETAKAVVDVPCPYAGRVVALHGAPGEVRPVGQPLVTVEPLATAGVPAEPVAPAAPAVSGAAAEPAAHATYREEERAGSGNVLIGYGTGHGPGARRRRRAGLVRSGVSAAPASPAVGGSGSRDVAPTSGIPGGHEYASAAYHSQLNLDFDPVEPAAAPMVISPLVRRLAKERGIDLGAVRGTGPGGMIRRVDLDAQAADGAPALATVAAGGGSAELLQPSESSSGDIAEDEIVIPLRGIRRAIADKLSRSRREIPEVTVWVDVDATGLLETRATINAARPDRPVSVLALLARICVGALRRFPELNSRVDLERDRIVQSSRIHLGIAAQTERGLVVPVIHDAHRLNTSELAVALAQTTAEARAGTLAPARLTGGTFTLNNYGVFGVDGSTPIINHPEAALLGMGRIVDKPWVVDGQLAVRKVSQISLTFDHRVCDGGVAGGFLRYVADCIERPALFVADV